MTGKQSCAAGEACEAVDVALDVALEAAVDPDVREHIRRAQDARVAEQEGQQHV